MKPSKRHQAYPEATLERFRQDEYRIRLKSLVRRVWGRRSSRARAVVYPRYQWNFLDGFVQQQSGETSWLLLPPVNTEVCSLALADFAKEQAHPEIIRGRTSFQWWPALDTPSTDLV